MLVGQFPDCEVPCDPLRLPLAATRPIADPSSLSVSKPLFITGNCFPVFAIRARSQFREIRAEVTDSEPLSRSPVLCRLVGEVGSHLATAVRNSQTRSDLPSWPRAVNAELTVTIQKHQLDALFILKNCIVL